MIYLQTCKCWLTKRLGLQEYDRDLLETRQTNRQPNTPPAVQTRVPRRWIIVSKKYTWCSDRVTLSGLQDARIRKLTSQAESDDGESYGECKMTTAQSCLQSTDSSDEGWVTDSPTSIFIYACFWNCSFGLTKSDSIKSCKTVSRVCLRYTLHFNIVRKELGL